MITERIDAITAIAPAYRATVLSPPRSVKIELTGRCNYACSFCARSMVLREQKDMPRTLFERRGFSYVFLTTNGSLAEPERLETCFRAGLDSLKFSFNYSDESQFAEIARVKPVFFRRMIDNIRQAKSVRDKVEAESEHRCGLYASYIEYDGEQRRRMSEALQQIEPLVDEIYALPLYSQADLVADTEKQSGWKPTAGNRGRVGALRDPLPCWAVFTEGHITWDGRLSACCFDHDGRFHMGDLTATPFPQAWNSEKFQQLRAAHLKKDVAGTPCESCVAYV
ncbi:MAG: SPASM domain-containing protein [Pseudolabrys sp.]